MGVTMTKKEYNACEKLMYDVIRKLEHSKEIYEKSNENSKNGNQVEAYVLLRGADQDYGEGMGINQVLVSIGFKHKDMQRLSELL